MQVITKWAANVYHFHPNY